MYYRKRKAEDRNRLIARGVYIFTALAFAYNAHYLYALVAALLFALARLLNFQIIEDNVNFINY